MGSSGVKIFRKLTQSPSIFLNQSIFPSWQRHWMRRRATSGRSCSLACRLFFKAEISLMHNFPNREVADCQAAVVQLLSFLKWRSTARRTRPTSSASATSSPRPHGTSLLAWIHRSGTVAPHPEVPAPARTTVSSSNKWRVVRRQTRPALSTKTSASRR